MPDILARLGREVLVVDGAMGTMLQRAGVPAGQCPEQLNLTDPETVLGIHVSYVTVGAECVTTNSFGGSRSKLAEYGLGDMVDGFNRAAVRLARRAGAQHVLADVGPSGLVIEPLGSATFDEVFEVFAEQITTLAAEDPDAILLETFTDLAEARCALLAARSVTDLPVIASMTFGLTGRSDLSGTDPESAAVVLEACGATAVGLNCGLGPVEALPVVEQMASATALPLIVQPNAGIPRLVDGTTVYPGTPDEMGTYAARFVAAGAAMVGSCCGSSPAFTGAIVDFAKRETVRTDRAAPAGVAIAGPRRTVRIGGGRPLVIIGERINPTGKKALAESLRTGSMSLVRTLAQEQSAAGADLLDVNVGAAGVDAASALPDAIKAIVGIVDLPLVVDTTDPAALEAALRVYPGRALVNSVNGSEESLRSVLPLAKRYGAAVVALPLDDSGIPETAAGRVAIVERIRDAARAAGLSDQDLVADLLVMTAATGGGAAGITLEALEAVSGAGLATVLGVSNVSHGLPGRPALNSAFLEMARDRGLSAAIFNPSDVGVAYDQAAVDVLLGRDPQAKTWIDHVAPVADEAEPLPQGEVPAAGERLAEAVVRGDADSAPALVDELIAGGLAADRVIGDVLTPSLQGLGDAFGRGEVFLPQLIVAADAMKAAVERVKTYLPPGGAAAAGRVVFATVKGDIHSIGKDICVSLLESQDFEIVDLGVDAAVEAVVEAARKADVVCLSALMTTTLPAMQATVEAVRGAVPVPVLVGGAVVTPEWAAGMGAGYAADAPGCVNAVRSAVEGSST